MTNDNSHNSQNDRDQDNPQDQSLDDQASTLIDKLSAKLARAVEEVFRTISSDEIVAANMALHTSHPDWSKKKKAKSIVRDCIGRCGGAGVTAASVSMIPLVGIGASYASIIPEEIYILRELFTMILRIGNIYDRTPRSIHFAEALALAGLEEDPSTHLTDIQVGKISSKTATRMGDLWLAKTMATRLTFEAGEAVAKKAVLSRTMFKGVLGRIPVLGMAIGGGMNIYSAWRVGHRSIQYFGSKPGDKSSHKFGYKFRRNI